MNQNTMTVLLLAFGICTALPAIAQNEVEVTVVKIIGGTPSINTYTTGGAPAEVPISTDQNTRSVLVRDNQQVPGIANVGLVRIFGNHGASTQVRVSGVHDLGGVITPSSAANMHIVSINITGDLTGQISSTNIFDVNIGGSIKSGASHINASGFLQTLTVGGSIETGVNINPFFFSGSTILIQSGNIEAGASITSSGGSCEILLTNGDMLGDLLFADIGLQSGAVLDRLDVLAGGVGTSGASRSTIRAKSIGVIDSANDLFANIVTGGGQVSTLNSLLKANEIIVRNGAFEGSFLGNSITAMDIDGDLAADVDVFTVESGTTWFVGDSFTTGKTITLTDDLAGQITFNNNNAGGTWSGDVVVGSTTLTPASYTETAASLGDGAAGVVPFGLHGSSCSPVDGGNITVPSSIEFFVRHYGPVDFTGGKPPADHPPVFVGRRVNGSSLSYSDQTAGFDYSVTGSGEHILMGDPVSGYDYQNGYEYKVEAITTGSDRLFCKEAVGDPGVDDAYEYTFTVGNACPADINGDGTIDTADLGILLANFGMTGELSIAGDLNNGGDVDTADLGILLGQFGNNCGGESAMAGGGGPTVSPLLAEMGFDTVEAYIAWLDTLTERELTRHIGRMLEWISEN